jgi:hypothetical protein
MLVIVPPVATGGIAPVGNQAPKEPSYHSVQFLSVLYLIIPALGLAGRCAVVPAASCIKPVLLNVVLSSCAI